MLCADLVKIHWKDKHGRWREQVANLEDISLSGACLQLDNPVPKDTILRITYPNGEFQGRVRYCMFREIGYFVGVQFDPGSKWSQRHYKPEHLLDLRQVVMRSMKRASRQDGAAAAQA